VEEEEEGEEETGAVEIRLLANHFVLPDSNAAESELIPIQSIVCILAVPECDEGKMRVLQPSSRQSLRASRVDFVLQLRTVHSLVPLTFH
jgi:hypothetical protein